MDTSSKPWPAKAGRRRAGVQAGFALHDDDFVGETRIEEGAGCCWPAFDEEARDAFGRETHENEAQAEAAAR